MRDLKAQLQEIGWRPISQVFRFYDEITNATIEDYLHLPVPPRHYTVIIRRNREWLCLGLPGHKTAMIQMVAPYLICHSADERFGGAAGHWFNVAEFIRQLRALDHLHQQQHLDG